MQSSLTGLRLYTIGHSNVSDDELIARLRNFEIEAVVDVRSVPYSQYTPQFNREPFERRLDQAGIEYRFAGEYLGGRPDNPQYYKREALPSGKVKYLQEVNYEAYAEDAKYRRGIDGLLRIAARSRTAIMCSEEDPERCHRHHLITQLSLLPRGVEVLHIRGNGDLIPAVPAARQASLF
jgi:uncharacterized protein (DUF488 family)